MTDHWYTVVENAGYEGETETGSSPTYEGALRVRRRFYSATEIDSLHVVIRKDYADGLKTYDF